MNFRQKKEIKGGGREFYNLWPTLKRLKTKKVKLLHIRQ
jgi:hypothetical protein